MTEPLAPETEAVCPACHHRDHEPGSCSECPRCELHTDEALDFVLRLEPSLLDPIIAAAVAGDRRRITDIVTRLFRIRSESDKAWVSIGEVLIAIGDHEYAEGMTVPEPREHDVVFAEAAGEAAARAAAAPLGTRLLLVADGLLEEVFVRDADGRRLVIDWGEPDDHGWYVPTVTKTEDEWYRDRATPPAREEPQKDNGTRRDRLLRQHQWCVCPDKMTRKCVLHGASEYGGGEPDVCLPHEHEDLAARNPDGTADPSREHIDQMARLLMLEWERVERTPVPVSQIASFADLARVALRAAPRPDATDRERRLTEALEAIRDATRKREPCPSPGNCMTPQAHSADESSVEFADRLRRMARAALAADGPQEPGEQPRG